MGTLAGAGLSRTFPLLISSFVLLHVFLSRSIVVNVECLISHNDSSCSLLALAGQVVSGDEHLEGI